MRTARFAALGGIAICSAVVMLGSGGCSPQPPPPPNDCPQLPHTIVAGVVDHGQNFGQRYCQWTCELGFLDCNADLPPPNPLGQQAPPSDGCETAVDSNNCGTCSNHCPAGVKCSPTANGCEHPGSACTSTKDYFCGNPLGCSSNTCCPTRDDTSYKCGSHSQHMNVPCCEEDVCIDSVCRACRNNGEACTDDSQCCATNLTCQNGQCMTGRVPPPTWTTIYQTYFRGTTVADSPGHCARCHASKPSAQGNFVSGFTKDTFYTGLTDAGLLDVGNPTMSQLADPMNSPLGWFRWPPSMPPATPAGNMPIDNQGPNQAANAAITAWLASGGQNN